MKLSAPLYLILFTVLLGFSNSALAQDATLPPTLGQETKGKPAVDETAELPKVEEQETAAKKATLLGRTKIIESRRENGQLYLIEIETASGSKQYIEEVDSDGKIESLPGDIEETPNLPKWKIGSW